MKRTLIALSLLLISGHASSEVTLYGRIKVGVESTFGNKVNGQKVNTTTDVVDYGSRIGFKGSEPLDNALTAIWQMEQWVSATGSGSSTKTFGTRESFIGLKGDFGEVRLGYQHGPLRWMWDANLWEYVHPAGGMSIMDNSTDIYRRRVGLMYMTPKWKGFEGELFVSPSDNNGDGSKDATIYQAGMKYGFQNGLFTTLSAGYAKNGPSNIDTKADGSKRDAYQVYGDIGYRKDPWYAVLGYKYSRNADKIPTSDFLGSGTTPVDASNGVADYIHQSNDLALSVSYLYTPRLKLKASAAYGWGWEGIGLPDSNGEQAKSKIWGNGKYVHGVVGIDYYFSKRTFTNFQYGYLQAGDSAHRYRSNILSLGMVHFF
ncbi:porin [Neisseria perflava]|uniref:porin n=1 Tax=Neisseria perflava TaxID=33053 RepID=UPI00209E929A|nr:porin [Neisseria perflava]MCP1661066.1 major outer membrane protein P.IB [Neisseria perflava]MCP1771573.1 major outer membrane protein P.IB [Neisseria perflava]